MPNFESSRRLSVSSGDGQTSPETTPTVTVNKQFKPARRGERINLSTETKKQPVFVSYSKTTADQIVDAEFVSAEAHRDSIQKSEQRAYNWLKGFKITGLIALAVGGAASGAAWSDANRFAPEDFQHYALMLSTMTALILGPWYAGILTAHLEKGIYRGIGKMIAWAMLFIIVADELATMAASRDPQFAAFFMVKIAPYVLPVLLLGATFQLYFRSSLKRKRDMMHMLEDEREIVAKNATDTRIRKAKKEMREKKLGAIGNAISHYRTSFFNIILNATLGTWDDMKDSWELRKIQRKERQNILKKKRSAVKK